MTIDLDLLDGSRTGGRRNGRGAPIGLSFLLSGHGTECLEVGCLTFQLERRQLDGDVVLRPLSYSIPRDSHSSQKCPHEDCTRAAGSCQPWFCRPNSAIGPERGLDQGWK